MHGAITAPPKENGTCQLPKGSGSTKNLQKGQNVYATGDEKAGAAYFRILRKLLEDLIRDGHRPTIQDLAEYAREETGAWSPIFRGAIAAELAVLCRKRYRRERGKARLSIRKYAARQAMRRHLC
jgi:hypothetical protein